MEFILNSVFWPYFGKLAFVGRCVCACTCANAHHITNVRAFPKKRVATKCKLTPRRNLPRVRYVIRIGPH